MTETCSNCRFSHVIDPDTYCRFDTPAFIPPNSSSLLPVRGDGWCGKWQTYLNATKTVPAPGSDPNPVRSRKLSVPERPKKGVAAIV